MAIDPILAVRFIAITTGRRRGRILFNTGFALRGKAAFAAFVSIEVMK
jgi:hypothetical protein